MQEFFYNFLCPRKAWWSPGKHGGILRVIVQLLAHSFYFRSSCYWYSRRYWLNYWHSPRYWYSPRSSCWYSPRWFNYWHSPASTISISSPFSSSYSSCRDRSESVRYHGGFAARTIDDCVVHGRPPLLLDLDPVVGYPGRLSNQPFSVQVHPFSCVKRTFSSAVRYWNFLR